MLKPVHCAQSLAFLYDGSFEGFLCVVFESAFLHLEPRRIVAQDRYEPQLFDEIHEVETDSIKAERVWNGLMKRGGRDVASMVRGAFLSELPGIELDLWHYQRKLFADSSGRFRDNVLDDHAHRVLAVARKVQHEAHLLTGFVRFQESSAGVSFAAIDPDYNVVELLASHFSARFPAMAWLIVDTRRGIGIHHERGDVRTVHLHPQDLPIAGGVLHAGLSVGSESATQDLWRTYHTAVNIAERKNTKLMTRLLPRKYWKYLPERQTIKKAAWS